MVYFIQETGTCMVKIGYTRNTRGIKRRIEQLQTSNPRELSLLCIGSDFVGAEGWWHATMQDYHIRGEWYELSPKKIDFVKRVNLPSCRSIQDILDIVRDSSA